MPTTIAKLTAATQHALHIGWRIACSPVIGAMHGSKEAYGRKSSNWKDHFGNEMRIYFSPLTGAISGVSKEIRSLLGKPPK